MPKSFGRGKVQPMGAVMNSVAYQCAMAATTAHCTVAGKGCGVH